MSITEIARRLFRSAVTPPLRRRNSTCLSVTQLEDRSVPAAISGLVYFDTNNDGIKNNNEATAPNIPVSYTPVMGGSPVSGNTDLLGSYSFTGIASGSYTIAFTAPTGYSVGTVTVASSSGSFSGPPTNGSTLISVGTENVNVVAGLVVAGSPPVSPPPPSPPPPPGPPPPMNQSPALNDISEQQITPAQFFSMQLVATDPDGDLVTYSASTLPTGLTLDADTGVVSGTVPSGAYSEGTLLTTSFSVSDGRGGVGMKPGAFRIAPAANPWLVNTFADTNDLVLNDNVPLDANGKISLRAAIQQANFNGLVAGGVTFHIAFDPVVFANVSTITLTRAMDPLTKNISIQGTGKDMLFINGGGLNGMFQVAASSSSRIASLTLNGGQYIDPAAAGNGGAISNLGTLTLDSIRIKNCTANNGGAISNNNVLTILSSSIVTNNAVNSAAQSGHGGGIDVTGGFVTIVDSIIGNNSSQSRGGAISIRLTGTVTLRDTIVADNIAADRGGGFYNSGGNLMMTGGRLSDNRGNVTEGGGMYHSGGNSTFQAVAIVGNSTAGRGGGMDARNGNLTLTSCTFQNNTAAPGRGPKVSAGAQLVPTVTNCIGFDVTEIYYGN